MADVRVNIGHLTRTGDVGMTVSTFGMDKLLAGVTGEMLEPIVRDAMQIAYLSAYGEWAFMTGASRDSLRVETMEVGARVARVALLAGGEQLKSNPLNTSKVDYAPFLEFNGSPSGSQMPGAILRSVIGNDRQIKAQIHADVKTLVETLLAK